MKFEQVLKIYWSKGFLYNGVLFNFDTSIDFLIKNCDGMDSSYKQLFIRRFEMQKLYKDRNVLFTNYPPSMHLALNRILAAISSINGTISEVIRYNIIRLYLTRSFRGRAQALGKPSRGQRTWSNAWTAHYGNTVLKSFISLVRKIHAADKRPEKIDYKRVQKKHVKVRKKGVFKKEKIKLNAWF
jgi:ribosomal protein S13